MAAKKEAPAAELDLDSGKAAGGSKKKMLILYGVIGVLILMVGGLGAMFFLGKGGDKEEHAAAPKHGEVVYIPLESMTVNFGQKGPAKFLQVDMQALGHNPKLVEVMKKHMPAIRNDLLMLLGSQTFEDVSSREGKEKLRAQAVEIVNRILAEQAKSPDRIETLYFTSFVMQ